MVHQARKGSADSLHTVGATSARHDIANHLRLSFGCEGHCTPAIQMNLQKVSRATSIRSRPIPRGRCVPEGLVHGCSHLDGEEDSSFMIVNESQHFYGDRRTGLLVVDTDEVTVSCILLAGTEVGPAVDRSDVRSLVCGRHVGVGVLDGAADCGLRPRLRVVFYQSAFESLKDTPSRAFYDRKRPSAKPSATRPSPGTPTSEPSSGRCCAMRSSTPRTRLNKFIEIPP